MFNYYNFKMSYNKWTEYFMQYFSRSKTTNYINSNGLSLIRGNCSFQGRLA
uniref:Uncharacterized protein n=1 Tax=Arundo donax TaxID=35708 RepID=A0A0A9AF07_ARUDO